MNLREVAWRVFAEEYNSSTLEHTGEGEKPVSYIVTPLGAKVNRMFVVGVVTDIEDLGRAGEAQVQGEGHRPHGHVLHLRRGVPASGRGGALQDRAARVRRRSSGRAGRTPPRRA